MNTAPGIGAEELAEAVAILVECGAVREVEK